MKVLRRLAARAPVPVFVTAGPDRPFAIDDLLLEPGLEVVPSIRQAAVLVVAGNPRPEDREDVRRLHDQMPHPRATLWWGAEPDEGVAEPLAVAEGAEPAAVLALLWQRLLSGERTSEADFFPDEPPHEWRGIGPHGQGGEGMMGGTPYGRPMPMLGDEARDGMALDAYSARFGPFLPPMPPGLLLKLTLQGDVIEAAEVIRPPLKTKGEPAPVSLRSLARTLDLVGLTGHAMRARALAREGANPKGVRKLRRFVSLAAARWAIPQGLGKLSSDLQAPLGGTDARSRFDRHWQLALGEAEPVSTDPATVPPLTDLLIGCEWSEAMLLLASFEPGWLEAMATTAIARQETEAEREDEDHGHQHGDGHGGHGHAHGGHA